MNDKKILTAKQRRKRNHDEMVADILAIAREMMRAEGVAALSFNAIARRLGMKPPSLYTYFDSKHAIYDALFRQGFETFARLMAERPDHDADFERSFRSALTAYMRFALENPELFQLMFERPVPGFVPSEESMTVSLNTLEKSRRELAQIIASGQINPGMSAEKAGDLAIVFMHGLAALHLANHPDLPMGEGRFGSLIDEAVQLFVQAWKK